jgi:hypothetical protein
MTSFSDSSLPPHKSLSYRIRAFNDAGYSAYCNSALVTTSKAPAASPDAIPLPVSPPHQDGTTFYGTSSMAPQDTAALWESLLADLNITNVERATKGSWWLR